MHSELPREGPGDNESTEKAYLMLHELPKKPRILDVGCGPGMQTIKVAKLSNGSIEAVDNHQPFLDLLRRKASEEGVGKNIRIVNGDLFALNYPDGGFDVVWSEGAIYIIGFERGLLEWKRLLKPKGYVVVSHISWLKDNTPEELSKFWAENYPGIRTIEDNLEICRKADYRMIAHFPLPEKSWWDNYYTLIERKIPSLKSKYRSDKKALEVLACEELEINLFRKYSEYYGYVFYLMQPR